MQEKEDETDEEEQKKETQRRLQDGSHYWVPPSCTMQKLLLGMATTPVHGAFTGGEGDTAVGLAGVLAAFGSTLEKQVVVAVVPSTFSGWSFQMSCVVVAVTPMPSMMARWCQGSPTQKPSLLPTLLLATHCGGGTVITFASFLRSLPVVVRQ